MQLKTFKCVCADGDRNAAIGGASPYARSVPDPKEPSPPPGGALQPALVQLRRAVPGKGWASA